MFITYGTGFFGKVAKVNNQWVETKFFTLMFLPIFPLGSMFVTGSEFRKRKGFDIATDKKSIIATYARLFTFIIAGWFFFSGYALENFYYAQTTQYTCYAIGCAFAALWIYFSFYFGKATEADALFRNKVGSITGIYAMPHWFEHYQLKNMLNTFASEYKRKYPDTDWKLDLENDNVADEKHSILYGLALFNCMVYDIPDNDKLYQIADGLYSLPSPELQDIQPTALA